MKIKVLVVEDDPRLRPILLEAIGLEGHYSVGVNSAEEAIKRLGEEKFDVVLTDVNLSGKSGLDLLPICLHLHPDIYLLVMTGYGTIDTAVQAMKLGAADFLSKPISLTDLTSAIKVAVEKISQTSVESPVTQKTVKSPIIAKSKIMLNLLEQIETIAPYKLNVLVTGETGTGKELIARKIHQSSPRSKNAFVALNCAAIPEQLLPGSAPADCCANETFRGSRIAGSLVPERRGQFVWRLPEHIQL